MAEGWGETVLLVWAGGAPCMPVQVLVVGDLGIPLSLISSESLQAQGGVDA